MWRSPPLSVHGCCVEKRMGIGASELAALDHLDAAGPMTPGQLGGRLSMTAGAVTALLDRLEGRGHVERAPNPDDRRSAIVREIEKARQLSARCQLGCRRIVML